jgi:hypothetical protein
MLPVENASKHRKLAPRGLGPGGKSVWRNVIDAGYSLDPVEYVLLHQLCRAVDNLDRISAEMATMGVVVSGSERQPRPNPLLSEFREQSRLIDALQRSLALPLPGESYGQRRTGEAKKAARAGRPRKSNPGRLSHHLARQDGA